MFVFLICGYVSDLGKGAVAETPQLASYQRDEGKDGKNFQSQINNVPVDKNNISIMSMHFQTLNSLIMCLSL